MEYKEGAPVESMLHDSGEDIFVSYRTGRTAIIKDGKIAEVIKAGKNYQKIAWKRSEWEEAEKEAAEKEQETASEIKEQIESTERDQKQLASVSNEKE